MTQDQAEVGGTIGGRCTATRFAEIEKALADLDVRLPKQAEAHRTDLRTAANGLSERISSNEQRLGSSCAEHRQTLSELAKQFEGVDVQVRTVTAEIISQALAPRDAWIEDLRKQCEGMRNAIRELSRGILAADNKTDEAMGLAKKTAELTSIESSQLRGEVHCWYAENASAAVELRALISEQGAANHFAEELASASNAKAEAAVVMERVRREEAAHASQAQSTAFEKAYSDMALHISSLKTETSSRNSELTAALGRVQAEMQQAQSASSGNSRAVGELRDAMTGLVSTQRLAEVLSNAESQASTALQTVVASEADLRAQFVRTFESRDAAAQAESAALADRLSKEALAREEAVREVSANADRRAECAAEGAQGARDFAAESVEKAQEEWRAEAKAHAALIAALDDSAKELQYGLSNHTHDLQFSAPKAPHIPAAPQRPAPQRPLTARPATAQSRTHAVDPLPAVTGTKGRQRPMSAGAIIPRS